MAGDTTYRHAGGHYELWGFTITEVSSFTNQLGRVLGLLHGREMPAELVAGLDALSPRFTEHLREMQAAWEGVMSLSYAALTPEAFAPGPGGWGAMGATTCVLKKIDVATFRSALAAAHARAMAPAPNARRRPKP